MGFEVLQQVIISTQPLGSREVARLLELEHSRTNRLLGTLVSVGLLQQNAASKYLAGPGLHVLSALSLHASGLIPATLPVLEPLQAEGATVALGTAWADVVVYLLHANPQQDLARSAGAHANFPREQSVLSLVLGPEAPTQAWMDRPESGERSWAVRIGHSGTMAIAAVLPIDHRLAADPHSYLQRLSDGARIIARAAKLD